MRKMKHIIFIIMVMFTIFTGSKTVLARHVEYDQSVPINEVSSFNNIVIFIRFADETEYTPPFSYAHYESLYNGVDQESLRDYFLEVSYGQLTIDSHFVNDNDDFIFYTSPESRSYFQPYSESNPDGYTQSNKIEREQELLRRALYYVEVNDLVDETINLDSNNDGRVDSLSFLISGEDDGWNSLLWPHAWNFFTYYDQESNTYQENAPMINGLYAWDYTFELLGNSTPYEYGVNVGVITHEMFHLLSAVDLYHYFRYEWLSPTGDWGLMDETSTTPSHMLGYMKYQYGGWIDTIPEITESGQYTLYPLQDSESNIYRIDLGYGNEYIYIEYRDNDGLYESNLPDDGLIIYHVDEDFAGTGNINGYYDEDYNPSEEVWLYRPGMTDEVEPIEFSDQITHIDVDGNPDNAALSQFNIHNSAGRNTDILFFDSSGNLINIKITNVEIKDGYIEFIVVLDETKLDLNHEFLEVEDPINYIDLPGTEYSFHIDDIPEGFTVHYTMNGTVPTIYSQEYSGEDIIFTANNNYFRFGLFYNNELIDLFERQFTFTTNFETDHDNYTNFRFEYWYLNFEKITTFNVAFDALFEVEVMFDRVNLIERDGTISSYKGLELRNQTFTYTSKGLVLEFATDYSIDTFYGFRADVEVIQTFDTLGYYLIGETEQYIEVYGEYIEENIMIVGEDAENSYYTIDSQIDTNQLGTQYVFYTIYNQYDEIIDIVRRTIIVYDDQAPEVTLVGNDIIYIEYGDDYIEEGATFTDNGPVINDIVVDSDLNLSKIGTYTISYYITDDAGNESEQATRTVVVIDTVAPTGILNPGIDTINLYSDWIDAGITAVDNYDTELDIVLLNWNEEYIQTEGTITVTYQISDSSGNISYIERYVHVVEHEYNTIDYECMDLVTTLVVGTEFELPECMSTLDGVDISNVDYMHQGSYIIYIDVTVDEIQYTFRTYVFVIDRTHYSNSLYYYDKKRREL